MKVKVLERMDVNEVRLYCIRRNLYTLGTNEDYSNMFDMCYEYSAREGDVEILQKIAEDIIEHSSKEDLSRFIETDPEELVLLIMFGLCEDCIIRSFVKEY